MFPAEVYSIRRRELKKHVKSGVIVFTGNNEMPMNYPDNTYHFRQDSTFLYYFGLDFPGLTAMIDLEEDEEIVFGYDFTMADIIWMGPQQTLKEKALKAGVTITKPSGEFDNYILRALQKGRAVHYLPQYRMDNKILLADALNMKINKIDENVSEELMKAVIDQRSVKEDIEIEEIEKAIDTTYKMHTYAMKNTRPGMVESEIAGMVEGISFAYGAGVSFPIILSVHGETLHNHRHSNVMETGRLVVHDSGAESQLHYAGDITRTFPVSGKFNQQQKEIYEIVLNTQLTAIKEIKPGIPFKQIHLSAAQTIAQGLKDIGIMKGDIEDAVNNGAHALFFPHGLGHMMGLDVHDMEGLNENLVGYDDTVERSGQSGMDG
jgi:Xaa-Pro aminopeptidase